MKNTVFGLLALFDVFVIDITICCYTLSTLWPQPPQYVKSISIFLRYGNKLMEINCVLKYFPNKSKRG